MAEHQLGVKKALDESDTALLLEVRGKLVLHCTAQQLRSNLWEGQRCGQISVTNYQL